MSWIDAVAQVGRAVVEQTPGVRRIGEVPGALGDIGRGALAAVEYSGDIGKEWKGDLDYYLARASLGALPNSEDILRAHEQGYDGFTGGRAVWEEMQADNPLLVRGALDVINPFDPLTAASGLGLKSVRAGVKALPEISRGLKRGKAAFREVDESGNLLSVGIRDPVDVHPILGTTVGVAGKGLDLLTKGYDLPGKAFSGALRGVGKGVRNVLPEKWLELSPRSAAAKDKQQVADALNEFKKNKDQMRTLSDESRDKLLTTMRDGPWQGKTIISVYDELSTRLRETKGALDKLNISWATDADIAARKAKVKGTGTRKEVAALNKEIGFFGDHGIDVLKADPERAATHILFNEINRLHGVEGDALTGYRLLRAAWSEQALFSVRYHAANMTGVWFQNILAGYPIHINPSEFVRSVRHAAGQELGSRDGWSWRQTKAMMLADDYGLRIPSATERTHARLGAVEREGTDSAAGMLTGKVVGRVFGKSAGRFTRNSVGKILEANQNLAAGTELYGRSSLWADVFEPAMMKAQGELSATANASMRSIDRPEIIHPSMFRGTAEEVRERILDRYKGASFGQKMDDVVRQRAVDIARGYEASVIDPVTKGIKTIDLKTKQAFANEANAIMDSMGLPGRIKPQMFNGSWEEVRDRITKSYKVLAQGTQDKKLAGMATKISRDYANKKNAAFQAGAKEADRVHFSYLRTNLDEAIGNVVPFHYWASRATRFYVEESFRNPVFLVNYARLIDGIDRMDSVPGINARSKGFIRLMGTPTGFSLLMNPIALFGVIKVFEFDSKFEPDGETELGKIIRLGKERGIGIFPWIDAVVNYIGAYGETFEPDPAGVRIQGLVGAGVNYIRASSGMAPGPAPWRAANAKLRGFISGLMESLTPGWIDQVRPVSSRDGSLATASLDDVIAARVQAENPNLTNGELIAILSDTDSPEYQSAYQDAANAGIISQLLNFTLPTTFKIREDSRDVDRASINVIREAAQESGVAPYEYIPTVGDAEFAEEYKRQTGKEFKPTDYSKAQLRRDMAVAPPETRKFVIQEYEYRALGTQSAQNVNREVNRIRSGEWTPSGLPTTLTALEREFVAEEWAARKGGKELAELKLQQRAYRETHPEFDEFKRWETQMYNLTASYGVNGLAFYRTKMQANPVYARWMQDQVRFIRERMPNATPEQVQKELDRATISTSAWFAATGRAQQQYSAQPEVGPVQDPATIAAISQQAQQASYQPQPPNYDWRSALRSQSTLA